MAGAVFTPSSQYQLSQATAIFGADINDLWSIVMTRRDEKAVSGGMLRARMEGVATVASGPAKKYSEPNRAERYYSMKPLSRHINRDWHRR